MYKHDFHRQEVLGEVVVEDFDDEGDHQDEEVQATKKSPNWGFFILSTAKVFVGSSIDANLFSDLHEKWNFDNETSIESCRF